MQTTLLPSEFLTMPSLPEGTSDNFEIQDLYTVLIEYIERFGNEIDFTSVPSSDKLGKLTTGLLVDLAGDMKDEICRRDSKSSASLPAREDFTDRRNNSRQKLSSFSEKKVAEYCADVAFELEKRNLSKGSFFNSKKGTTKRSKKESTSSVTKAAPSSEPKQAENDSSPPTKRARVEDSSFSLANTSTLSTGMDSLFAMIDDIGSFVGDDSSSEELEAIKQKHALEVAELNNSIAKYENVIIPEKNREIVKLMSKVEEADMQISRLNREVAKLKDELNIRDQIISDQKAVYATLNAALERIQQDLAQRANSEGTRVRSSLLQELKSSPLFRELKALNQLISKAIAAMEDAVNSQNHKSFLKLLRDVANAAKSSLIGFERVIQYFAGLEIEDVVGEADEIKSSFVQSLSSLLVAGKDYGMTPSNSATLRSALESFKAHHETISSFQTRLESSIDLL